MIDGDRIDAIRGDNTFFLGRNRDNPVYRNETRLHTALDIEYLLSRLDRANEALKAVKSGATMHEFVVKHRLGAFLFTEDAYAAVARYGLGELEADPSTLKGDK